MDEIEAKEKEEDYGGEVNPYELEKLSVVNRLGIIFCVVQSVIRFKHHGEYWLSYSFERFLT